jgi:hypothetical protein
MKNEYQHLKLLNTWVAKAVDNDIFALYVRARYLRHTRSLPSGGTEYE